MMYGHGWGMSFLGLLGGLLLFALFVAAIVVVVVLIVRAMNGRSHHVQARLGDTALETLRNRLAAGDITVEQYDELKNKLTS